MRFLFLLKVFFISASFDILASQSVSRVFQVPFKPMKILVFRHSQSSYHIRFYKLNLMCEKVSNQITDNLAVNQANFCYD